jgi:hypothetical protein
VQFSHVPHLGQRECVEFGKRNMTGLWSMKQCWRGTVPE